MERIGNSGIQLANANKNLLLKIDQKVCGETQLPAILLEQITDNRSKATELAIGRIAVATGRGLEVIGTGLSTYGLSNKAQTPIPFLLGKTLEITGAMVEANFMNENGSRWRREMDKFLWRLSPYSSAIKSVLANRGISVEEISNLMNLPNDIYTSELTHFNTGRMARVFNPISSAVALASTGEYATAGLVTSLGLASFPLGEYFYKQADKHRRYQAMAGRSAKHDPYVEVVSRDHIKMTNKLNFLSRTPEILFAIKFITDKGGNLLATFNGLKEGLTGLSGMLSFQRSRENSRRSVEIATHLIDAITTKPFIATPQRWREHVEAYGTNKIDELPFDNGIIVDNFKAVIPSGEETSLEPFSFKIQSGNSVILQSGSGEGKSVTLMGIMHLLENSGSIHIVENGVARDVHSFSGNDELSRKILLVTEEGLNGTERISDIFKHAFETSHRDLFLSQIDKKTSAMLLEVAWRMGDSLLEAEINKLHNGEKAVFPKKMLAKLIELREVRNFWVNENLKEARGNISKDRVNAERVFGSLSSGEKRRLLVSAADTEVKFGEAKVVILDEPLAHLDDENRKIQLEQLKKLQADKNGIALIIVTHEHIQDMINNLNACQHVKIESNGK